MSQDFFKNYKHKIKTSAQVKKLIGSLPRKKTAILCHGVFDVVHPGHLRHLAYAKTKADILIVSITTDKYIKKGTYRPHIPEGLRALNLAALEMVDYVLIDKEASPLKNIKLIKPNFFAKGYEYTSSGLPEATKEEAEMINNYGGEMIYTPGDVVYSSTKLLDLHLPQVQVEKLLLLMEQNNINFHNLRDTLQKIKNFNVHVIGDTIVDSYTRANFIGGQTKTPTLSVLYEGQDNFIGGAGVVAKHIKAAGAKITFSTVLGDDKLKNFVIKGLDSYGIKTNIILDPTRPTVNKNAIIAGGYRLLKLDTLDNRPISNDILQELIKSIKSSKADAFVFSDFRHGIFNKLSTPYLIKAISKNVFRVADSQVASRWGNITDFSKFDLISPNEREARFALADQDSTVGNLAALLQKASKYKNLILKLGDKGVFCLTSNKKAKSKYFSVDSFAKNVVDPVGAGDALLGYATLSMLATNSLVISSILGSLAAACECEIDGNVPIESQKVLSKIDEIEKTVNYYSKK